jgi:hypothetical protein
LTPSPTISGPMPSPGRMAIFIARSVHEKTRRRHPGAA